MKQRDPNTFQYSPKRRSAYINILIMLTRGLSVFLFLFLAYLFYGQALRRVLDDAGIVIAFVMLWLVTAYIVIPRVHRFLAKIYLPDYYIGRSKSADGMLADPVNLAVIGNRVQLETVMKQTGWIEADSITPRTTLKTIFSSLLRRRYSNAPMSGLLLFGNKQDLAYQKAVLGNSHARHHVRFWRVPEGWLLPGGLKADWLGAATFDKSIGFSLFTGQLAHKIEEETDIERDFVVNDLEGAGADVRTIKNFNTAYHHYNGGGDSIRTDGAMPFIRLRR